jgi:hypothetical protein
MRLRSEEVLPCGEDSVNPVRKPTAREIEAADAFEAQARRIAEIKAALDEILHYTGGANNALEDEYVMERARAAYLGEKE